ncbi:hypothetical protein AHF37_03851 [Paragonimus kellicotti]|nr:hypothetical protein AHF37_03851 [Paragonimus kellicotti]
MTSMLPPKLPPPTPSMHTPNVQARISTSTSESNHDHEQNLKFEDTTVTANLTEDSMMISPSRSTLYTRFGYSFKVRLRLSAMYVAAGLRSTIFTC